jgi:hypothetical protein
MRIFGWRSQQMVHRYGSSAADERARGRSATRAGRPPVTATPLPWYAGDPIRRHASTALNMRKGKALVDIRCAVPVGARTCGWHLGGAWSTPQGTVVLVNRLKRGEASWYGRVSQSPETRQRLWEDDGFVPEIPIMLRRGGGVWHDVPGDEKHALVRCPKHGSWALDRGLLKAKVEEAFIIKRATRFQTRPN